MFARCARVAPAIALRPSASELACTSRCFSCCSTLMPLFSASVSEPLAPFTVTLSAAIVALTPCGRSTGFFATRDMMNSWRCRLLNDEEHFAAGASRARLPVGHDPLRRRDHRHPQTAQHLRQLVLAAIDAQPRTADALDAVDDRTALVVLQLDGQSLVRARGIDAESGDVALVLQHLENGE